MKNSGTGSEHGSSQSQLDEKTDCNFHKLVLGRDGSLSQVSSDIPEAVSVHMTNLSVFTSLFYP